jgi:hypothetical protein
MPFPLETLRPWAARAVLGRLRRARPVRFVHPWPVTTGTVITSSLTEEPSCGWYGQPVTLYTLRLRYDYGDGRESRTGTAIRYDSNSTRSRRTARRWAAIYAPGTAVTVYCDPADPGLAILEPPAPRRLAALVAGATLVLGLAAWLLLAG